MVLLLLFLLLTTELSFLFCKHCKLGVSFHRLKKCPLYYKCNPDIDENFCLTVMHICVCVCVRVLLKTVCFVIPLYATLSKYFQLH